MKMQMKGLNLPTMKYPFIHVGNMILVSGSPQSITHIEL